MKDFHLTSLVYRTKGISMTTVYYILSKRRAPAWGPSYKTWSIAYRAPAGGPRSQRCKLVAFNYRVLVRVCVFPCFCMTTQKVIRSRNMKLEYIVVYENISDKFDVGHCRAKVKVSTRL